MACAIAVIRASRSSQRQRIPATTTAIALMTQTAATRVAAIFTAMILAAVLGPLLHWLEIALACIGLAAAVTVGLTVRRRWRQRQALPQGRYVPWLQPQPQRQQFPAQQPPASVDGGQHLHLHLGGLTAAERAEVMRQLRGGQ